MAKIYWSCVYICLRNTFSLKIFIFIIRKLMLKLAAIVRNHRSSETLKFFYSSYTFLVPTPPIFIGSLKPCDDLKPFRFLSLFTKTCGDASSDLRDLGMLNQIFWSIWISKFKLEKLIISYRILHYSFHICTAQSQFRFMRVFCFAALYCSAVQYVSSFMLISLHCLLEIISSLTYVLSSLLISGQSIFRSASWLSPSRPSST